MTGQPSYCIWCVISWQQVSITEVIHPNYPKLSVGLLWLDLDILSDRNSRNYSISQSGHFRNDESSFGGDMILPFIYRVGRYIDITIRLLSGLVHKSSHWGGDRSPSEKSHGDKSPIRQKPQTTKAPGDKSPSQSYFSFNTLFLDKKKHSKNTELIIKPWKAILKELLWVSEANEVPNSSHIRVASLIFKQL